jgi:hypothetical protein
MQRLGLSLLLRRSFVRSPPRWEKGLVARFGTDAARGRFPKDCDGGLVDGGQSFQRLQAPGAALLLKGLVAAGIVNGARDPRWLSMSIEDAARTLVSSGLDPDHQVDGSVRRSILLARQVAEGHFSSRGTRDADRAARGLFYEMLEVGNTGAGRPARPSHTPCVASCLAKALGRPPRTVWLLGSHSARPMPNAVECRIVSRARYDRPVERSAAKQRTIAQASGENPPSSSPSRRRARRAHVRHLAAHAVCTAGSGLFPPLPLPFPMTVC